METLQFRKVTPDVERLPFDCGVKSINDYVKNSYYPLILQRAYTYSIMSKDTILGYYQVLFRDIELDKFPEDISDYRFEENDFKLTAVHLNYIAIDKKYQGHKIGSNVLRAFIKKCRDLAEEWPIRVITIDANVDLVGWYSSFDFQKMPSNTIGQEGVTTAMYLDCMRYSKEFFEYCDIL